MTPAPFGGFLRMQQALEAAASVSLSHATACDCTACRAAAGDDAAMAEILELLEGR